MISVRAARAAATNGCGFGWVNGTPGDRISAATFCQSTVVKSRTVTPALAAASHASRLSSQPMTLAPPAINARAEDTPERASPNTATVLSLKCGTGITFRVTGS